MMIYVHPEQKISLPSCILHCQWFPITHEVIQFLRLSVLIIEDVGPQVFLALFEHHY